MLESIYLITEGWLQERWGDESVSKTSCHRLSLYLLIHTLEPWPLLQQDPLAVLLQWWLSRRNMSLICAYFNHCQQCYINLNETWRNNFNTKYLLISTWNRQIISLIGHIFKWTNLANKVDVWKKLFYLYHVNENPMFREFVHDWIFFFAALW